MADTGRKDAKSGNRKEKAPSKDKSVTASNQNLQSARPFSRTMLLSIGLIIVLILIAAFVSWLPSLLMSQASNNSNLSQQNQTVGTTQSQYGSPNSAPAETNCTDLLTNGSESYDSSYEMIIVENSTTNFTTELTSYLEPAVGQTNNVSAYVRTTQFSLPVTTSYDSDTYNNNMSISVALVTDLDLNFNCLSSETVISFNGTENSTPETCSIGSEIGQFVVCKDNIIEENGSTQISVGNRTFNATVYFSPVDNSTVYMTKSIPLPIKIISPTAMMEFDLLSFKKVV